jgi:DinB superfamily
MAKRAAATAEAELGKALRKQLQALLDGGQAHATFDEAVKDFPAKLRGVVPEGLPYSGWQILEHIRLTQRDILDFSSNTDGSYKELKWPEEYWPKSAEPKNEEAWEHSIAQIREDRKTFEKLLKSADDAELVAPFTWGDGQNLLREALLLADHDAYHLGELVVVRWLVGAWKK